MNTVLKLVVVTFSFAFTGYFVALLLSLFIFAPIAGALVHNGYRIVAGAVAFVPFPLALMAAYQAARTALRLERQRQDNARKDSN